MLHVREHIVSCGKKTRVHAQHNNNYRFTISCEPKREKKKMTFGICLHVNV